MDGGDIKQVSSLELFFDLVFVFAITQLSHVLLADLSWGGAAQTLFLTLAVWGTWTTMTWWTNIAEAPTSAVHTVLVVAMFPCLLVAIAVPETFEGRATPFVLGYVGVRASLAMFGLIARKKGVPAVMRAGPVIWTAVASGLWVAGLLTEDATRIALWCVALAIDTAGPWLEYRTPGFERFLIEDAQIAVDHLVERFQLFIIIVLGESIVLTGATAAGLELTAARVAAIAVAVLVTAVLWRLYFGREERRAQELLASAPEAHHHLARDAYTYLHLPIVAGLIVVAVANELVIAHPDDALHGAELVALAGGPVLFLLGTVAVVWRAFGTFARLRAGAAGAVALVALAGPLLPALATWTAVLAILAALAVAESRRLLAAPA